MRTAYRFRANCGRMGRLSGVFIADDTIDVPPAIGKCAYFGEVLGKHSEIYFDLRQDHFEEITKDSSIIELIEKFGLTSGYNPLDALTCKGDCGDVLEPPYTTCKRCGWKEGEQ